MQVFRRSFHGGFVLATLALALLLPRSVWPASAQPDGPAGLRARYTQLEPQLARNPYGRPLHIDSVEEPRSSRGDVHAVIDQPFTTVSPALADPGHWCDVLILHLNTKYCRRNARTGGNEIELRIGKKHDQPLAAATRAVFAFRTVAAAPDYLDVEMDAPDGPFDTRDYRILLEAVPLDASRTFVHMSYSLSYGAISHMAMHVYLATTASDKVGFSAQPGARAGEAAAYVTGMRGLVERNTMRYYLAIEAYLGALTAPPADQLEKRLAAWFAATEKYSRQLHEVDQAAYLDMKRREYRRQQTAP